MPLMIDTGWDIGTPRIDLEGAAGCFQQAHSARAVVCVVCVVVGRSSGEASERPALLRVAAFVIDWRPPVINSLCRLRTAARPRIEPGHGPHTHSMESLNIPTPSHTHTPLHRRAPTSPPSKYSKGSGYRTPNKARMPGLALAAATAAKGLEGSNEGRSAGVALS